VKLTIGYSTDENRLFIIVHSCRFLYDIHYLLITSFSQSSRRRCISQSLYTHRALAACSKDGADPYVSFILLPDKKATTKRRTTIKKRELNPEFNER